jgi:hypothetical protein
VDDFDSVADRCRFGDCSLVSVRSYLFAIAIIWLASTVTVIPLHFYRAWLRWSEVPNRRQYAAWVGFETLATMALIGLFVYSISSR